MKRPLELVRLRTVVAVAVFCVICMKATQGYGWWNHGHEHISENSVQHLPDPLRAYFQTKIPSLRTYSGQEPPGTHYIDIDFYPEFFAGTFPRDIDSLIALYGQATVDQNGTAPWTVVDYIELLSTQMASANTAQDWANLLQTAGALAHYIEDLHNPLHLTLNYNGQLTGNNGIHSRYEGQMILRHLNELIITPMPESCVYLTSPLDAVFDGIDVNYWFNSAILAADTLHRGTPPTYDEMYYDGMWQDTGAFTQDLFRDASLMVASMWYTAWVDAGSPNPICGTGTGDFDGGGLGTSDISYFVESLLNPTAGAVCTGDLSGDGFLNGEDIGFFMSALLD